MYLLVIFLPLLGFFFSILGGNFFGKIGSLFFSCFSIGISMFFSFFIFYEIALSHSICLIDLGVWINTGYFFLKWGFLFDTLTSVMLIVVNTISFLVHLYSIEYMQDDPHIIRFFSFLSLFTFFMLLLISADNFLQMFLGWEGVGLSSYLLISFWYSRFEAVKCSLKAIIVNRIGDFGIYMALMSLFNTFYSLDYAVVFSLVPYLNDIYFDFLTFQIYNLDFICFFLFLGAIGKSAQLGLHTWLPDAMEGPTPVSALIHAATMVTAGIFIVIRCSYLFEASPKILFLISFVGALTAFFASCIGFFQYDLKRIIAFSTCSQLGYMFFCCGLSNYSLSLFHLFNHAFFKALLFLSAGAVIHAMNNEQDLRKLGGLFSLLPFTYTMFVIGSLSLMGIPFFTGFYSKDVILEFSYFFGFFSFSFTYWLGLFSAFFTSFYSFRLLFLVFYDKPKNNKNSYVNIHEASNITLICLFILALFSIFVGYLFKDLFIGLGTDIWQGSIYLLPSSFIIFDTEFTFFFIKIFPVLFSIFGAICSIIFYNFYSTLFFYYYFYLSSYFSYINKKWFFDNLYNYFFVHFSFFLAYDIGLKLIDRGFLEIIGPLFFIRSLKFFLKKLFKLHSGLLFHYCFLIFIFLLFILLSFNTIFYYLGGISFSLFVLWVITYITAHYLK